MSLSASRYSASRPGVRVAMLREEQRRAIRTDRLGEGTLACPRCDAPVAIGADRLSTAHPLTCPFCLHRGPLRAFLSLAVPARPAKVVVRVAWPAHRP